MKKLTGILAVLCFLVLSVQLSQADQYYVYCANGKIEVDTRNPQQMKSARGSGTYMMSSFSHRIDAEKFAKQLGGIGASCPRR
ncbi:MAG: hypothetical protein K6G15_05460 [Desulfovibrio sp.]|nr:hypothetical protein [Desulfovibrio sp.]